MKTSYTGIWPFITQEPAKRSSKNKKRGEMETKPIQSITKEHIREMLITNVLPTIRAKWPAELSKHIYIQQDNAKPHIAHNDRGFLEEAMKDGFNIQLVQQPPNSPDMNVLDLGFFRSIQALQYQKSAYNVKELLKAVNNAFQNLSPQCLRYAGGYEEGDLNVEMSEVTNNQTQQISTVATAIIV
ncbi:uncharacterized protein LOC130814832 isoform X2 [Amaranthus tricolor]|uniref:uncharacterized protein LOC130814832 isoform X2 n=1 Tax=Amaranthus tricolor TaxID=29722 RepID=UPI00258CFA35|nr:uncharacterized protein LOC130814832 isoform X2 [Amaranthus tricolor]